MQSKYIFDACAFIDMSRFYPRDVDIFRPFWDKIDELSDNSSIETCKMVIDEVQGATGADNKVLLSKTKIDLGDITEDEQKKIQECVKDIFVKHPNILKSNKGRVTSGADAWVIAFAEVRGLILVTQEHQSKVDKIPDICKKRQLKCISLLDFMRDHI